MQHKQLISPATAAVAPRHPGSARQRQRGITLIESLVALVVAALGVLGIVGIQMRTLIDTSSSVRRAQAVRLIEDLSERMRANPNALMNIDDFVGDYASMPAKNATPSPNCATNACNSVSQAQYDLFVWQQSVLQNLPGSKASVFTAPGESTAGNQRQLGVIIAWRENERAGLSDEDKELLSTTTEDRDGAGTDDTKNACPEGYTCHLQYIPLPARCAPYNNGAGYSYHCA